MGMGQNLVPLVNIKIAGKWMFIPLKMVLIGIDPYPYIYNVYNPSIRGIFLGFFGDDHPKLHRCQDDDEEKPAMTMDDE